MKKMYKLFIDFLVKYYSGSVTWKIGKLHIIGVKPYLGLFILFWAVLKIIQSWNSGVTYWAWWDTVIVILLIPQVISGFSMFAVNEQKRLNEEEEKNNKLK